MFFFFFDVNNSQTKIGSSPKEADIAIVSINNEGDIGELNQIVLKEYGYDKSILKQLNLTKGFDLFQLNSKPILFIVTVGIGNPLNNLKENLRQALTSNWETLANKKIWIPLMASGVGNLSYEESYEVTVSVLEDLKVHIINFNCQFIISLPNNKKGQDLYKQIKKSYEILHYDIKPNNIILKNPIKNIKLKEPEIFKDSISTLAKRKKTNKNDQNIRTLPGLLSDSEIGEDFLDIQKDVEAFARVIAAKSFEPPLAIALLGKWGSGKSFFMHKLKENIQKLCNNNPQKAFCEGIAHVHFNSWSYMDANLWASIVTRIFETLDDYIKNTFTTEKEIKNIENQILNKLNISREQLNNLNKQKESIVNNIQKLQTKKDRLKSQLDKKISTIKAKTLIEIIKKVDQEFNVRAQINETLAENPTFVETSEKFRKIVPEKYWDNPTEFYNQLKSGYTFFKAFLHRDKLYKNVLWITIIILLIALTPRITYLINLLISWQNFTLTNSQWLTISIISSTFLRIIDTFLKLKKQIAPFWKIKEDYESIKANALFEFEQEEKGLILEIENFKQDILQIDTQILLNKEIKATLEFKLKNALSTETLYNFIEKKANSDDYKKHLGIISLIRKDFEILSGLLTNHKTELVSNKESQEFKELFWEKKPLERIILYIDDLDRCCEERVVEVIEAVNLLMAFPLFVVIVGVDPRWVKSALQEKYKNQFSEETISPSDYLEKIFQIPFNLKDASNNSIKYMIKTLAKVEPSSKTSTDYDISNIRNIPVSNILESIDLSNGTTQIDHILPETFLPKKETIEALDITEKECDLLQDMSEIIGNNPRAVKRFINIYKIVKTHESFEYDKSTEEKELMVIMFLLALSMGNFKHLVKSFENYLNKKSINLNPISDYFSNNPDKVDQLIDEKTKKLKDQLKNLLSINLINLYKIETDLFAIHYPFIKRFTFKNI